jgi:hypothetical protein
MQPSAIQDPYDKEFKNKSIEELRKIYTETMESLHKLNETEWRSRTAKDGGGLTYKIQKEWEEQGRPMDHPWRRVLRLQYILRDKRVQRDANRKRRY